MRKNVRYWPATADNAIAEPDPGIFPSSFDLVADRLRPLRACVFDNAKPPRNERKRDEARGSRGVCQDPDHGFLKFTPRCGPCGQRHCFLAGSPDSTHHEGGQNGERCMDEKPESDA